MSSTSCDLGVFVDQPAGPGRVRDGAVGERGILVPDQGRLWRTRPERMRLTAGRRAARPHPAAALNLPNSTAGRFWPRETALLLSSGTPERPRTPPRPLSRRPLSRPGFRMSLKDWKAAARSPGSISRFRACSTSPGAARVHNATTPKIRVLRLNVCATGPSDLSCDAPHEITAYLLRAARSHFCSCWLAGVKEDVGIPKPRMVKR